MSAAACLLAYAVAVAVIAPRILPRLTRSGVAPRLGVVAWLVAIASAAASSIAFVGVVAADTFAGTSVFAACEHLVRAIAGAHSIAATRFVTTAVGVAAGSALLLAAVRLTRNLAARRRVTFGHARSVLIVGRRVAGVDAVVLDAPERAAYCVAGRPDAIVVTSGALDALDHRQLDAVLAHERAHLAGRHPQLLAIVRGLADVAPRLALFTAGATDIARLLEMCADDRAMRAHTPHTLLRGLVTLAGSRPIPDGACGAGNVAVLARAGRLASPPGRGDLVRNRALLSGAIAFLGALPLGATTLAVTGRMLCLTTLL
ncbi:peptidase M48-like protein [Rhodococcus sp. OK519]|uniref:M56 family metallopeptidase n=1 Tax=Rhodococcus sp. OK519 TaxID=2135729 RepID=UPI000D38ECC0|nr:peptidase M48-like protein [Rhodococcus sp. OK519]